MFTSQCLGCLLDDPVAQLRLHLRRHWCQQSVKPPPPSAHRLFGVRPSLARGAQCCIAPANAERCGDLGGGEAVLVFVVVHDVFFIA